MADNDAVWKDPRPIARAATIALWGELAVTGFGVLSSAAYAYWRDTTPLVVRQIQAAAPTPSLLIFLGGAIVIMMWIYRVCRNTQAAGLGANRSAWGALLWYLVPIASLWKPLETFSETWKVAHDPHGWRTARMPPILAWWWGLWLAQGFAGYAINLLASALLSGGSQAAYFAAEAINTGITVGYLVLFLRIVPKLTAAQVSSREQGVFD